MLNTFCCTAEKHTQNMSVDSSIGSRKNGAISSSCCHVATSPSYPKVVKHTPSYNIIKALPNRLPHHPIPCPPICHQMQMKSRSTVVALRRWRRLLIYSSPSSAHDKLNNLKQMQLYFQLKRCSLRFMNALILPARRSHPVL